MPAVMRRMAHVPPPPPPPATIVTPTQQNHPHTTFTATSTITKWERRTRTRGVCAAAQDTTPPRAVPYVRTDIPEKFLVVGKMTTTTIGLDEDLIRQTNTASTIAMDPHPQIPNASKMNQLHIPDPPAWVAWFLALLLILLFLTAGLLAFVTIPPRNFRQTAGRWRIPQNWVRSGRKGRGRYHGVDENDEDDDDDDDEDDGTDHFCCPQHPTHANGKSTSTTPDLEIRSPGLRKRNLKDLRIDTTTAQGYHALGISVKSPETAVVSSVMGSAKEFLFGVRRSEVRIEVNGEGEGFLKMVGKGIENVSGWVGRVFEGEVKRGGAEHGLLFRLRDCEREGWNAEEGGRKALNVGEGSL